MSTTKKLTTLALLAAITTSSPSAASATPTPTSHPAPAVARASSKPPVDVDAKVINAHYAFYGESYTAVEVRAKKRKTGKPVKNGTVELTVTFYPKGYRLDEDGDWMLGATGAKSATTRVTVQLNSRGRGKVNLGENCRFCAIPPLAGARAATVGVVYAADGTSLGTDPDPRKKVTKRTVKGEKIS